MPSQTSNTSTVSSAEAKTNLALAASPKNEGAVAPMEAHPAWAVLSGLSTLAQISIPVRRMRVREVLALEQGQTLPSDWATGDDVPLECGGVELGWGELEIAGEQIALRLTRLA